MTNKIRLAKLICESMKEQGDTWSFSGIADYLIKHGVIVPYCEVGDTLYGIRTWKSTGRKVVYSFIAPDLDWILETENELGKTIFLTREEAEKAGDNQ